MLRNYFHIALRNLLKNRTFALLNIFGLGLSLASCMLIFMLVRHHLSFEQFHTKADRAAAIITDSRREGQDLMNLAPYPMGAALRQDYAFLEKTAMVASRGSTQVTISREGQAPVKFKEDGVRAFAEPELFDIFDFPLVQGSIKAFGTPYTALITEKTARKYFGTTDAVGERLTINSKYDLNVVGVLRDIPENTDLQYQIYTSWSTFMAVDSNSRGMLNNWGGITGGTQCFVLFRDGQSRDALNAAFPAFREKYHQGEVQRPWYYSAVPIKQIHLNPDYGSGIGVKYLWTLGTIGFFLLLTACFNFINMATAQALRRAKEVGVRKTMGSTRPQLFWQFMSETGVIVLLATVIGILLAKFTLPLMNSLTGSELAFHLHRDLPLCLFLGGLMVVVTFLAGAYPGLAMSGFRPAAVLRGTPVKAGGFSLRRLLVGTQFAVSQALIIGAVVITSQLEYARNADLGFRKEGIVTLPIPGDDVKKFTTLKSELDQISGIEKVSFCMEPPASDGNWQTGIQLEGRSEREPWLINCKFTDDRFADVFGLQLVAGRGLQPSDTLREYIVNEEVVKKLGLANPEDIIGKKLSVSGMTHPVVGVVKNFHNLSFREGIQPLAMGCSLDDCRLCTIRLPLQNAKTTLAAIEKTWTTIFPEYYYESEFMDARLADFYESEGIILQLIRLFAGIAVFIGCLGLYGLAAFMVARKTKEIGIRKTLGAGIGSILWLFGKEYARLMVVAFLVAGPFAWWAMEKWLNEYTYRIPIGAGIFAVSLMTTFLIALITVGGESARAALTNPVKSLRSE